MKSISKLVNQYKEFRCKHFTWFVICESLVLVVLIACMMFLTKVTEYLVKDEDTLTKVGSVYHFELFNSTISIPYLIPIGFSLITFIYTLVVEFIKDVLKNPILAKKLTKSLLIISIISFFANVPLIYLFNNQYVVNGVNAAEYSHRLAFIITAISHVAICADIYFWRSNFEN